MTVTVPTEWGLGVYMLEGGQGIREYKDDSYGGWFTKQQQQQKNPHHSAAPIINHGVFATMMSDAWCCGLEFLKIKPCNSSVCLSTLLG